MGAVGTAWLCSQHLSVTAIGAVAKGRAAMMRYSPDLDVAIPLPWRRLGACGFRRLKRLNASVMRERPNTVIPAQAGIQ